MATRTRQAYLKDLTLNHSSNTTIEPVQKFCKLILILNKTKSFNLINIFSLQQCCHLAVRKKRGGGQDFSPMLLKEVLFVGK
jgi:hypothetical protein